MSAIFGPAALAALRVQGRVVLSPMTRMQAAEDGTATAAMAAYYARYARAGLGLLITEAAYTDEEASRAYFRQPGMANAGHVEPWARVARAVHDAGAKILLQLQHGGRLAEPGLHAVALGASGEPAAGSSWQMAKPYAGAPLRAATAAELERIVDGFAQATARARAAGFDGVEIHGARGYLLDELLSQPGVPLRERLRVPLAVARAVRAALPDGVLSFNFSLYKMDDVKYQPPGGRDEVESIARALAGAGVDAIHVSTRRTLRPEPWGETLAATVKRAAPACCVIANGGLVTREDCEAALEQTGAGFVALARALLANPDWLDRVRRGLPLATYRPGMEREPLPA
ncbi:MAG: tRNA-dihydrouridine synthase [Burkholderiales bacterium]